MIVGISMLKSIVLLHTKNAPTPFMVFGVTYLIVRFMLGYTNDRQLRH